VCLSLSISLSLSYSLSLTLTHSLTHPQSHTLTHSLIQATFESTHSIYHFCLKHTDYTLTLTHSGEQELACFVNGVLSSQTRRDYPVCYSCRCTWDEISAALH